MQEVSNALDNNPIVLLYFFSDDCAPCKVLREKIRQLPLDNFPLVKVVFIPGKENPEICARYRVLSLPVLMLMAEGKEHRRYGIHTSVNEITQEIIRLEQMLKP